MRKSSVQELAKLQRNTANIRNICILAHVDHGKTTLADSLVASNGIISQRLAGKMRYLDSREDEQARGITMKSSAISLHFERGPEEFLINLIDSPGHIDFSSEVSTAVRLCDGAVILVDVVEGICPQTQAVLRQAWLENIKPVLVLNKLDRLITEWKLTPQEAQTHLQQVLEQVNAITGGLFTSEVLAKSAQKIDERLYLPLYGHVEREHCNEDLPKVTSSNPVVGNGVDQVFDWSSGLEETDDSLLYFSPDQGNVVFASAIDGWGFRLDQFAELYARKVGVSAPVLNKTLWGDFYLDAKAKTVRKGAQAKNKKTLFVQLILENIWKIYDVVLIRRDKELTAKIVQTLGLTVRSPSNDAKTYFQCLMNQWLPLSNAVLSMVCEKLPSPLTMNEERVEKLLCATFRRFDSLPQSTQQLKKDFLSCSSSDDVPVIVFVSKMFTVDTNSLPQNRARPLTMEEIQQRRELLRIKRLEKTQNLENGGGTDGKQADEKQTIEKQDGCKSVDTNPSGTVSLTLNAESTAVGEKQAPVADHVFIAFARVFSGTIRKGQKLYVLGPKHDPSKALEVIGSESQTDILAANLQHVTTFQVNELFMFMGRELECLDEIPAGNILGIGGLEDHVLKSATVASTVACPAFTDMYLEATPIVRVAIEPKNMAEMKQLVHGLRLLNQSDPCVEILVQDTGEHIVIAAGEVHLQKCLDDLRHRFAKIEIDVSSPAVPFRETIITRPMTDRVNELIQEQQGQTGSKQGNKQESETIELSTTNGMATLRVRALPLPPSVVKILEENSSAIKTLNQCNLGKALENSDIKKISKETLTILGEMRTRLRGAFEEAGGDYSSDIADKIWSIGPKRNCTNVLVNRIEDYHRPSLWSLLGGKVAKSQFRPYDSSVVSGFQIATQSGPLCEESMMGVCFFVEEWEMDGSLAKVSEATENDSNHVVHSNEENLDSTNHLPTDNRSDVVDGNLSMPGGNCHETTVADDESMENDLTNELEGLSVSDAGSAGTVRPDAKTAGQFRGQLMTCMKECCRRSFQLHPQRLMWAMYSCIIQATADVLGKMYAVLAKRNGRVLYEDLKEGTSIFNITALLPVAESFGLSDEIRKRTSGLASPQLKFSHWEVIDIDPFWVPTTEEEYLHFGEKADSENVARKHMNAVRRRKGLKVNEKIVEFAEKQRTLKKNK